MAKITGHKKYREDHPDVIAVRRYESEIAALEVKYAAAEEAHDWTMRNFYGTALLTKRSNLKLLKDKMSRRLHPVTCD